MSRAALLHGSFFAMTKPQRAHFFGHLWPAACQAQGWEVKDETTRHAVCLRVTGQESMSGLNQRQLTALFTEVRHLADPLDFDKATLAANPDQAEEASRRAKCLFAINRLGLPDSFIAGLAKNIVADRRVQSWRDLCSADLRWLAVTLSARRQKALPAPEDCPF